MDRFVPIADGLDVAPALAELGGAGDYWVQPNLDPQLFIQLIGGDGVRLLENELPGVWRLIDQVHAVAAAEHGDQGVIGYARVGLMPPGSGYGLHRDGIDGDRQRRYHIALQHVPGAELVIENEARCYGAGEAWWVDASRLHSVANKGAQDRMLILFDTVR